MLRNIEYKLFYMTFITVFSFTDGFYSRTEPRDVQVLPLLKLLSTSQRVSLPSLVLWFAKSQNFAIRALTVRKNEHFT